MSKVDTLIDYYKKTEKRQKSKRHKTAGKRGIDKFARANNSHHYYSNRKVY